MGQANKALAEVTGLALDKLMAQGLGPFGEWLLSTGPKLDRFKRQQAIEDAIVDFLPDADEAAEILDALTASLRGRYEDRADNAIALADKFRASLAKVESGADCIDEMTLAKDAAIAEREHESR